jgi:L-ascorbate metabolism protein UlaG (beta-lactamase superfamily)
MRISYLGHSAFVLTLEDGRRILFDPYESGAYGGALAYAPITGSFDVVVVSHDHADHCCAEVTSKASHVIDAAGTQRIGGITVTSIPTFHDDSKGAERGKNLLSVVEADGLRIVHLGDLGHSIGEKEKRALGAVDIVFVPVGGHFTIDAETAVRVVKSLGARIVIPMHFKTDKVDFPVKGVEAFTGLMENVERAGRSEITVTREALPGETKVVVLEPAL